MPYYCFLVSLKKSKNHIYCSHNYCRPAYPGQLILDKIKKKILGDTPHFGIHVIKIRVIIV